MSNLNVRTRSPGEQHYYPTSSPTRDRNHASPPVDHAGYGSSTTSVRPEHRRSSRLRRSFSSKLHSLAKLARLDAKASRDDFEDLWNKVEVIRYDLRDAQIRTGDMEEKAKDQDEAIDRLKAERQVLITEIKELAADGAVVSEEVRTGTMLSKKQTKSVRDEAIERVTARLSRIVKEEADDEREFF